MKLITRQSLAREAAQRFFARVLKPARSANAAHPHLASDTYWKKRTNEAERIYRELSRLGIDPDPDEVDALFFSNHKNYRCRVPRCDECGVSADAVILFGKEEPDYGYGVQTTFVCFDCVHTAHDYFVEHNLTTNP